MKPTKHRQKEGEEKIKVISLDESDDWYDGQELWHYTGMEVSFEMKGKEDIEEKLADLRSFQRYTDLLL